MLWESQKVMDSQVLLKDSELKFYQEKHTEVIEELDVSVLGIQVKLDGLVHVLVNMVTSTEHKLTREFTELEMVKNTTKLKMQLLNMI